MTGWEDEFVSDRRVARLATVDEDGRPHVVPNVYAFDGERLYTPIDEKPKRVEAYQLQRVRNIRADPRVAVIVDVYDEDWTRLAWVQIRGRAELLAPASDDERRQTGVALLHAKYPQYAEMPLDERPIVVIAPAHVASWRADDGSEG